MQAIDDHVHQSVGRRFERVRLDGHKGVRQV